jgi:hypothetical protein
MKNLAWKSFYGKSSIKILGTVSFTNNLIKAMVLVSSSEFLRSAFFKKCEKLSNFMLVLSARAFPKVDFPEHLGPIKKKVSGSIAFLVS